MYAGDDNWASVHMIYAGGSRDIEFIYENAATRATRRPTSPAAAGGRAADYWVRITSDGSTLNASYSFDGETFIPVGRPADISSGRPADRAGRAVRRGADLPDAFFDWIRFYPDGTSGGGGGGGGGSCRRRLRRHAARRRLGRRAPGPEPDGERRDAEHPGAAGRPLRRRNNAKNLVAARRARRGLGGDREAQLRGHRPVPPGRHPGLRRRRELHEVRPHRPYGRPATRSSSSSTRTRARRATTRPTRRRTSPADFPDDFWVRHHVRRDERDRRVLDRRDGLDPGRPRRRRCRRTPRSACSRSATTATGNPVAAFDSFTLDGRAAAAPRARASTTSSTAPALDTDAGTRSCATTRTPTRCRGGAADDHDRARRHLHRRHDPAAEQLHPPGCGARRRGLGDRDEAVRHDQRRLRPGRPDRLLRRRQLRQARPDLRCRVNTRINRIELRSEVGGRRSPDPQRRIRRCRPARHGHSGCA